MLGRLEIKPIHFKACDMFSVFGREGNTGVAKRSLHLRTLLIIIIINIIIIIIFNVIVILIIIILIIFLLLFFWNKRVGASLSKGSQWSATLHGVDSKRINGLVTLIFQGPQLNPRSQVAIGDSAELTIRPN